MWFVYAGDNYYPMSGMGDFVCSFISKKEADAYASSIEDKYDWVKVVNIERYINKGEKI